MAPSASKFATLPFNCYELGHTWNPNCNRAAVQISISAFTEGFKIYSTLSFVSILISRRFPKSKQDFLKILKDILRSSTFLSLHGLGYVYCLCKIRQFKGNFNYFTLGFLPTLLPAYLAILLEKPQRRPLLALYVTNVATDSTYRMLKSRGLIRDIKNFGVFLFCFSMVTLIFHMKNGIRNNDIVDTVLTKIFGADEFAQKRGDGDVLRLNERRLNRSSIAANEPRRASLGGPGLRVGGGEAENVPDANIQQRATEDTFRNRFIHFVLWMHKNVEDIASHLERMVTAVYEGQIHEMCPHNQSCFDYWMEGFYTRFLTGFGVVGLFQLFTFTKKLLAPRNSTLDKTGTLLSNSLLYPCVRSGMGLGMACLAFRLINCSFRWLKGMDGPGHTAFAGALSSTLGYFLIKPPSALGLYLFFKAIATLIGESHKKNNWKIINLINQVYGGGWCLLYSISTAWLFHASVVEPHNLKPSYFNFLAKTTGKRMFEINRQALDIYGTNSTLLMKNYWPKLDEKYLSKHMKKLLEMKESIGNNHEAMKQLLKQFVSIQ